MHLQRKSIEPCILEGLKTETCIYTKLYQASHQAYQTKTKYINSLLEIKLLFYFSKCLFQLVEVKLKLKHLI